MTLKRSPHSVLPIEFGPLITWLEGFQQDVFAWQELKGEEKEKRAAELVSEYHERVSDVPRSEPDVVDPRETDLAFVEGTLRAMHLRDTIVGEFGIVDTFGSETIQFFDTDFRGDDGDEEIVLAALAAATDLTLEEVRQVEAAFEKVELAPLNERKMVIDAIGRLYQLDDSIEVERVFAHMYASYPVTALIDITAIRTATSLFFCVPFHTVSHMDEKTAKASDEKLAQLWARVSALRQRDMAHFPVFGFFRGERADVDAVEAIAAEAGITYEQCTEALTTMVSILPAEEVDKYIVHDAWGHQWQSLLFAFEDTYRDTALYRYPPPLARSHDDVSFSKVISQAMQDDPHIETIWKTYLDEEIEERVIRSVSGLFAEVLADAMEYKFLHLRDDLREKMPSSSFLKALPAKLDLTLHDLPIYTKFATRGIEQLWQDPKDVRKVVNSFLDAHPDVEREAVVSAVEKLAGIAKQHLAQYDAFGLQTTEDEVRLNPIAQLMLQFFELVESYNETLRSSDLEQTCSEVFKRHFDLLVFTTASFFERRRTEHFWQIDTFIRDEFPPRYEKFQTALRNHNG